VAVYLRPMDGFVATGGPAGALGQTRRVIRIADENAAGGGLLLEVAFQAKRLVALVEHPLVHRAVGRMAADATLAHGFVLENKRPALRGMALQTGIVVGKELGAAALHALGNICAAALDGVALVRVMAIRATDLAFEHGVMVREKKRGADFGVTLETGRRRLARIDDENIAAAAGFHVQTARAVAGFAAHVFGVGALGLQPRVRGGLEITSDRFVTGRAFFGADKFRTGNTRRRHDRARRFEVAAGKQNERDGGSSPD